MDVKCRVDQVFTERNLNNRMSCQAPYFLGLDTVDLTIWFCDKLRNHEELIVKNEYDFPLLKIVK